MQMFLVMGLGVFLSVFGASQYIKYSNTNTQEIRQNIALVDAGNVFIYNDLAVQYLLNNYIKFNDPNLPITNSINYNPSYNFNYSNLESYNSTDYRFTTKFNYQSTYFLYKNTSVAGDSSIPTLYLLTTWNNADKVGMDSSSIFGGLNTLLNSNKNDGDKVFWTTAIFGLYKSGKITIYSLLPQNLNPATVNQNTLGVINTLEQNGFKMGNYFYLSPVYMYN